MANMNGKTAFQIGLDSVSKIAHPRKHSQEVDASMQDRVDFLASFKAKISRAAILANKESSADLATLLDEIRYSDPVGTEETQSDEVALLSIADELVQAAESGEPLLEAQIARAKRLLAARNETCKRTK